MSLDWEAIFTAYPECTGVVDNQVFKGDEDVTSTLEQTKIDAARVELDKLKYKRDRSKNPVLKFPNTYPSLADQLDQLYHDIDAGKFGADAKTGSWFVGISSVKAAHPKP